MQDSSPTYSPWMHPLMLLVAWFVGIVTKHAYNWVLLFLGRHKPQAEIHEISARATKTLAEARQIQVRSDTEVSNIVLEVTARIMEMQEKQSIKLEVVTLERDQLRQKVSVMELEMKSYEMQIDRMSALMKLKGVKYADADKC